MIAEQVHLVVQLGEHKYPLSINVKTVIRDYARREAIRQHLQQGRALNSAAARDFEIIEEAFE